MAGQERVKMDDLRNTVMAALSEGQRLSAHPADRRLLLSDAARIALAIQAEFGVFWQPRPALDAQAGSSPCLETYE